MRKLTFLKNQDITPKLMVYESTEGVYLFGFDTLADTKCVWDQWFESVADADEYTNDTYGVLEDDWITVSDPCDNCQHDLVVVTIVGTEAYQFDRRTNFNGLTGNERLWLTGLTNEFDTAVKDDKDKAVKILAALEFDLPSINKIVYDQ